MQGSEELPNLVYVGDVPIEESTGGSALLYRLLERYPAEKLRIVEFTRARSEAEKRLPRVSYQTVFHGFRRPLFTRAGQLYGAALLLWARSFKGFMGKPFGDFDPDAILTVAHGFSWPLAAQSASSRRIDLHMLIHDDAATGNLPILVKPTAERWFGETYRQAATRQCASPHMAAVYERRYGAPASVLYPLRAATTPLYPEPPGPRATGREHTVFAYAGSLHSPGYLDALITFSNELGKRGATLKVYSPLSADALQRAGLHGAHVLAQPLLRPSDVVDRLRNEADVLFVPMSFDPVERKNMELAFPSKLTDYTATGLPLLVWGPETSSVVGWARSNLGVAELIDRWDTQQLSNGIERLIGDADYRHRLGKAALDCGRRMFSYDSIAGEFQRALIQCVPSAA